MRNSWRHKDAEAWSNIAVAAKLPTSWMHMRQRQLADAGRKKAALNEALRMRYTHWPHKSSESSPSSVCLGRSGHHMGASVAMIRTTAATVTITKFR